MAKSLSIIIPCFNESGCLIPLFEKLQKPVVRADGALSFYLQLSILWVFFLSCSECNQCLNR